MAGQYSRFEKEKEDELRIVLVGKTGVGKSATGNTILDDIVFKTSTSFSSETMETSRKRAKLEGKWVHVVDTPGLFDTNLDPEKVVTEIKRCISLLSPGPHVFLVVIQIGRFTKEEQETVKMIQETFGQKAADFTMVLFTKGDELEEKGEIGRMIADHKVLQDFVRQCKGGYHVFNNKNKDRSQVKELQQKIDQMLAKSGASHYTNDHFQESQRAIIKAKAEIMSTNPRMSAERAMEMAEENNSFIQNHPYVWIGLGCTAGLAVGVVAPSVVPLLAGSPAFVKGAAATLTTALKVSGKCQIQ